MAVNKEIWIDDLQENFFPDDSFVANSVDDSEYVDNKKVHIPNAGAPSKVEKNRPSLPATIKTRTDADLEYGIDEFTTDPIRLTNVEMVELAYDKRHSILKNDKEELQRAVHMSILRSWVKDCQAIVRTSGEGAKAHTSATATGQRRKITANDILQLTTLFNKQEIPREGRYLLLDSDMYLELVGTISEADKVNFFASADAQKGIMGKLYGFIILERSSVLVAQANGTILEEGAEAQANEVAVGVAWHKSCVSRAMGEVKMFDNTNDPTYYGDIYSFLMRSGGSRRRHDGKGIALLMQGTV